MAATLGVASTAPRRGPAPRSSGRPGRPTSLLLSGARPSCSPIHEGYSVAALAYGLWKTGIPGLSGRIGVIALAVMGIGQFFDGWFRLDCRAIDAGCSGGGTGWQVVAHEIESLFTVLGLLVSVFAPARAFKKAERWRDWRIPTLIAGFATVAVFIGLLFVGGGLAVRLGLGVWFAWVALVSYRVLTIAREDQLDEVAGPAASPA